MMTIDPPKLPSPTARAPAARPTPPRPPLPRILLATAWREGSPALPYAVLLLLLAGVGIACGLYMPRDIMFINPSGGLNALLSSWSHLATTIFFALAGIAFGTRQAYEDRSLDAWTLLIHRPASRLTLFLGRSLAGLTLYTLTAALTLTALWLAGRSHFAGEFFHWRFLLPAFADAFAGLAWYFAAMAAAERHAHWWASRIFPLGPALLATLLVVNAATFPHALLAATPFLLLAALTAYASFASHGFALPRNASLPGRAALALSLTLGFTLTALFALAPLRTPIDLSNVMSRITYRVPLRSESPWLLTDGSLGHRIVTRSPDGRILSDEIRNAQGDLVATITDPTRVTMGGYERFRAHPLSASMPTYRSPNLADANEGRRISDGLSEWWYWVDGAERFYGRRGINGPPIGTLGRNGFVPPGATAQPLDGTAFEFDTPFGGGTQNIYALSLNNRTILKLAHSTPAAPIEAAGSWHDSSLRYPNFAVAVATPHALTIYANDGRILHAFPLAHDPLASQLRIYDTYASFPARPPYNLAFLYHLGNTVQLDILDPAGKLLSTQSAPALTEILSPLPTIAPDTRAFIHRTDIFDGFLDAAQNPLALAAARHFAPSLHILPALPRPDTTPENIRIPSWRFPTTAATLLLLALLTALLAKSRPTWPLWTLATLLLGLPTLLALLAIHPPTLPRKPPPLVKPPN